MTLVSAISQILSLLTIVAQILSIGLIIVIVLKNGKVLDFVKKYALLFSFIVALTATMGSLFYSEVAGLTPCKLCWFQRIFMYPQVILLGLALLRKNSIADYILGLAIPGALIAGYNYLLQLGLTPSSACSVAVATDCSQGFIMNFGDITISLMAFSAFLLIILLQLVAKRSYL